MRHIYDYLTHRFAVPLELQYDCPRKSLRLLIRCAEHHPKGEGLKQLNKLKLDPL